MFDYMDDEFFREMENRYQEKPDYLLYNMIINDRIKNEQSFYEDLNELLKQKMIRGKDEQIN